MGSRSRERILVAVLGLAAMVVSMMQTLVVPVLGVTGLIGGTLAFGNGLALVGAGAADVAPPWGLPGASLGPPRSLLAASLGKSRPAW
ncbi:hypothetical protein ABT404_44600 [Streptomyces hyaluromycini]|uniref:MFS transporter n=1 Tax=Streptomyces hyaluromycini TaxID=1377993 RepID=A0ABV1XBQ1_9ACTN